MKQSSEAQLRKSGLDPDEVGRIISNALREDLGPDHLDVTSVATIPAGQVDTADLIAREDGVVAGLAVAELVFDLAGPSAQVEILVRDGDPITRGQVLATI